MALYQFIFQDDTTVLEKQYRQPDSSDHSHFIIHSQALYDLSNDRKVQTKEWFYEDSGHNRLSHIESYYYGTPLIKSRWIYPPDSSGAIKIKFQYPCMRENCYDPFDANAHIPIGFVITDLQSGHQKIYDEHASFNLDRIYAQAGESKAEIARKKRIYADQHRLPVAIIDTGFDIFRPALAYKMWNPPVPMQYTPDPIEQWQGFRFGWSQYHHHPIPAERISTQEFLIPYSHGTNAASILASGREDIGLVAFAGNIGSRTYLKNILRTLMNYRIRFVNLSMSFPASFTMDEDATLFLIGFQDMLETANQTLFVVAAGNDAATINMDSYPVYPAGLDHDNMLVIGALDTDELDEQDMPSYQIAPYSNRGPLSVDLFCPGTNMRSVNIGGRDIQTSGTSFATPYCLNHGVLAVAMENPTLTIGDIIEVLLKSAYIPNLDRPLPARSGGMLFKRRALAIARLLKHNPHLSVEQAVLSIRSNPTFLLSGESNADTHINQLKALWKDRNLSDGSGCQRPFFPCPPVSAGHTSVAKFSAQ